MTEAAATCAGHFRTVLADPPWTFRDGGSRAAPQYAGAGRAAARYKVSPLRDIESLGVLIRELAAPDCFLFLWAPNALVLDGQAQRVAESWGFAPKQLIPWLKTTKDGRPALGIGHYSRTCTEQLILCRRGRATVRDRGVPGVIIAPRGAHSAKPDESYRLIERLAAGPYLELYARRQFSPAWTVWGNEV